MRVLVTGGAGFIGSAVIREFIGNTDDEVLNLDCLTYAGNEANLADVQDNPRYSFVKGDIRDADVVSDVIERYQPDTVMHLAAESHVDRSIDDPSVFVYTNVVGTYNLLASSLEYFTGLSDSGKASFRFHHISTDEVFGDLGATGRFSEETPYRPSSPYSASKAASDHLVRAWHRTYQLPALVTNCSNNYGPYHFPEKLIPLMILNALDGKPLPVYGDGQQVRDWLFVEDHARALRLVAARGRPGETYNIGGNCEVRNIDVVRTICRLLEAKVDQKPDGLNRFEDLITFVDDRPGHDVRYAMDTSKITAELGWRPVESFETGLEKTIDWYLANMAWVSSVQEDNYNRERLGVLK